MVLPTNVNAPDSRKGCRGRLSGSARRVRLAVYGRSSPSGSVSPPEGWSEPDSLEKPSVTP